MAGSGAGVEVDVAGDISDAMMGTDDEMGLAQKRVGQGGIKDLALGLEETINERLRCTTNFCTR